MHRNRLRWWGLSIVIAALALLGSFYLDNPVHTWVAHHQTPEMKDLMHTVSRVGDWPGHMILGLALLLLARLCGNKKWMRIFLSMLIALALAGVSSRVIKIGVGRARPDVQSESQWWNAPQISSRFNAFPSGHMAASTGFFAVLLFATWRIGLLCMVIPLAVGFSRIYVSAHRLSDVVAAAILGLIAAFFATIYVAQKVQPPAGD